jgi:acyl-CoA reductase-like NAD-dependent aldehyde dehydrogenase
MMTPSRIRRVALVLMLVGAAAQLVRPARTNPSVNPAHTVEAAGRVPPQIASVLRRSCFDCHSNETRWPWYSEVVPMSWGVANHVREGRAAMNFSEWGTYPARKRFALLEKLCDEVREGQMPLASYLWLHRDARLSEAEWKAVCDWSTDEADRIGSR